MEIVAERVGKVNYWRGAKSWYLDYTDLYQRMLEKPENYMEVGSMRELTQNEVQQVSGGIGPFAIIAVDLALTGVMIGATQLLTSDYFNQSS